MIFTIFLVQIDSFFLLIDLSPVLGAANKFIC